MLHVSYGLFDDAEAARSAIEAIEVSGTPRARVRVQLHRDRLDEGQLTAAETGADEGRRIGAALGALGGAVTGAAVMGPMGLVSGGALGALYGGVAGALGGSAGPDPTLERLSRQLAGGKVLLVVEASSLDARDAADAGMRACGGRVEHKPFV
jgi:hypothetical protein